MKIRHGKQGYNGIQRPVPIHPRLTQRLGKRPFYGCIPIPEKYRKGEYTIRLFFRHSDIFMIMICFFCIYNDTFGKE